MRKVAYVFSLVAAVALLLAAVPTQAGGHGWRGHSGHGRGWYGHGHHGTRVVVGLGSGFWWGPGPGWYAPRPAYVYPPPVYVYPPRAYVYPPRVIVAEPPVYIQREVAPEAPASFWHYCESAGAYYPTVPSCPEPWVKVAPRPD